MKVNYIIDTRIIFFSPWNLDISQQIKLIDFGLFDLEVVHSQSPTRGKTQLSPRINSGE